MSKVIDKNNDDVLKRIKEAGLPKVWKTLKKKALHDLSKSSKSDGKKAVKIFDKGLSPAIKKYYSALDKFPDLDTHKIQKRAVKVSKIIKEYTNEIEASSFPQNDKMVLKGVLAKFKKAMDEDLGFYLKHMN